MNVRHLYNGQNFKKEKFDVSSKPLIYKKETIFYYVNHVKNI